MAQRTRRYLIRRAVVVLLTLFVVTLLSFLLMRLSPIDPATAYVKRNSAIVTQEQIDEARVMLGLDKPLPVQYFDWVVDALHMDFGISLGTGNPVTEELAKTVPVTLTVVAYSAVIMSLGVLGVGMLGYLWRQKTGGMILSFLTMFGISVPGFYLGTAFIDLFAVRLGWISVSGKQRICSLLSGGALPVGPGDLLLWADAGGLTGTGDGTGLRHVLTVPRVAGGAHPPIPCVSPRCGGLLPSFAQMLGLCLANAAIVERVFSLSGLGYLIIDAVVKRDSPVIHAAVLVLALTLVLLDTAAELLQYGLRSDMRAVGGRA